MTERPPLARRRLRYGPDPRQFVDLTGATAAKSCVLLVHGGFWRVEKDAESLWPAVTALAATVGCGGTVEYRTADADGVWPRCRQDVVDAVRQVWRGTGVRPERTVLVGHSAGGQLALTAAAELPGLGAVVGLAAVSDLAAAQADGLGDGAVAVLFGRADLAPDELRPASPIALPAPACRVELLHGDADQAVPVAYSERLAERWGGSVRLSVLPGARHMHLVNPERPAWAAVANRITALVEGLAGGPLSDEGAA